MDDGRDPEPSGGGGSTRPSGPAARGPDGLHGMDPLGGTPAPDGLRRGPPGRVTRMTIPRRECACWRVRSGMGADVSRVRSGMGADVSRVRSREGRPGRALEGGATRRSVGLACREGRGAALPVRGGSPMTNHVYSISAIGGSTPAGVEAAVNTALAQASRTLRNLDCLEATEIRGHLEDGKVADWQVGIKLGFRVES